MRTINVMVGGPVSEIPEKIVQQHKQETWIGIDYGATYLLSHGIKPQLAAGDFDSTNDEEMSVVRSSVKDIRKLPAEKDETDTQFGTRVALTEFAADRVNIFGGTGGRLDQLLANLMMPLQPSFKNQMRKICFIDKENVMTFYPAGSYEIHKLKRMRYLAFVNLVPVRGLTLPDEKYVLHDFNCDYPMCWSSNEFKGDVNHFSFDAGVVAVIQSWDQMHGNQ